MEYIELDYAGFNSRPRYTHYPSGDTCLRQPYMNENEWITIRNVFLKRYSKVIWQQLGDISTDEEDQIAIDFLLWEKGTHREEIWHWFEDELGFVINDKMELEG